MQKRKAQNRAAQRAFRERKEKHVKDLEIKVEELEKASHSTSKENSQLRAQMERMQAELGEYKKRLALMSNTRDPKPSSAATQRTTFGNAVLGNMNDVNFQFEFPKFGQLPGFNNPPHSTKSPRMDGLPSLSASSTRSPSDSVSPSDKMRGKVTNKTNGLDAQTKEDLAKFSGIFSPPLTDNVVASASRGGSHKQSMATSSSSPSSSSNSNGGPSSSCGTSPEPANNQSPTTFKPDTLGTIGEEYPSLASANHGKI